MKLSLWMMITAVTVASVSCKKSDEETSTPSDSGKYVLAVRAAGSASETTDYIVQQDTLSTGTISLNGRGIEQRGFRFYSKAGNKLMSITYTDDNKVPVYTQDENLRLKVAGQFSIPRLHMYSTIDDNTILAMNIPRNGTAELATFYKINVNTMSVAAPVTTNVFDLTNRNGEQAYFSSLVVRGDKLFAPFFQIKNSSFASTHEDSAYVAIYSYPGLVLEKVIRDNRTGPIGVYAGDNGILKTENGDLYTISTTAISSGYSIGTESSGILRINDGETEFDNSYFFNVQSVTGGYKLAHAAYLGNGKALAQIYSFTNHVAGDKWSERSVRLAVIDLYNETVDYISGVPLHTGGPSRLHHIKDEETGKLYVKINSPDEGLYIYEVDIVNKTGIKGTKIEGANVMGMFKMKN